jgi:hypothetical protein
MVVISDIDDRGKLSLVPVVDGDGAASDESGADTQA